MVVSSFEMQGTHISQSGPQLDGKQHHTGDKGLVRTAPSQEGQPLWESSVVQSGSCSAGAGQLNTGRSLSYAQKPKIAGLPPPPQKTPTGPAATAEPAGL